MVDRTCSVDDCESPVHGRNLCSLHYQRLRRNGTVEDVRPSEVERFWAKVQVGPEDECWLWTGSVSEGGYGHFVSSATGYAHRFSYILANGAIPDGLTVDHQCHNADETCSGGPTCLHRRCVNPLHLTAIPIRENCLNSPNTLAAKHAAVTHCPQGHPYDEANTVLYRGLRRCRACSKEWQRQRRRSRRADR
jgi:hypothetical protein